MVRRSSTRAAAWLPLLLLAAPAAAQTPHVFPLPERTGWAPQGERAVGLEDPVTAPRQAWRNIHSDTANSDEITGAIAPLMRSEWTREVETWNWSGPVFDDSGNLYFSPVFPYENVVLISLDRASGLRRWSIPGTGAPPGLAAPLILRDPSDPSDPSAEIIYLALYDRALAVRPDGSVLWDVPTGLTLGPDPFDNLTLGTSYVAPVDAIAGLTSDGHVYLLDRATGAALLPAPYPLPGERTPDVPPLLPPALREPAEALLLELLDVPPGSMNRMSDLLLGNDVEAANMFSVDPSTGRLWVAATAADGADGTLDGVSELGALYGLDVVPSGGGAAISVACSLSFEGGSASTPSLRRDGTRIYLGDNFGKLLAIGSDCQMLWEVDLGSQITGSIAVSSDNDVVYASTLQQIFQVFDRGSSGEVGWQANLDLFDLEPGQSSFNLNLVSIGANGLAFQAGAGILLGANVTLPLAFGIGLLDRETGEVRSFTQGGEETVAVMSTGADGALYIGNSPLRRAVAIAAGLTSDPLTGGITKFARERVDLLMRDALCAAADRDRRASSIAALQPEGSAADARQGNQLVVQARDAATEALVTGDLTLAEWSRIAPLLDRAESLHDRYLTGEPASLLDAAAEDLEAACRALDLPDPVDGWRIVFRDDGDDPSRRFVAVNSRDSRIRAPVPGGPGDPTLSGAVLTIRNPETGEHATLDLPSTGWRGIGKPAGSRGYRFKNPGGSACRQVKVWGGRQIHASCAGDQIDFTLDEASQGSLAVTLQLGIDTPQCVLFGGDVRKDFGTFGGGRGSFRARHAPAPTGCPVP